MEGMTPLDERTMARRGFLKRALVVGWTTPMIMSIMSEHAVAQTPACGSRQGANPCTNAPSCPPSAPHCCRTSGNNCGCYTAAAKVGQTNCNPA